MKKSCLSILLSLTLLFTTLPVMSFSAPVYTDVPAGNWSERFITSAKNYGLMQGMGEGLFGFGRNVTNAEFATILCQMFGWDLTNPATPSFSDVPAQSWYYTFVETALANNVMDKTPTFRPDQPILREEMAVMLVRALGYQNIAASAARYGHPFRDVTDNAGYITIAYDIGMIKGTSATTFAPKNTAKREEAATMLVQVYEKYISQTNWLHGFYAFSSYNQRELTNRMNAVSAGWSRMSFDPVKGAVLNTTSSSGNEWIIPTGYENITSYLAANRTPLNLNVFMDTAITVTLPDGTSTNPVRAILLDPTQRTQAVQAILKELTVTYNTIGMNPYSGVTIDFEGLRGTDQKAAYNAFLEELSGGLKTVGKSLYVAVHPAVYNTAYFDGYDFRTIGRLADKVILMAHDYQPSNLNAYVGTTWHQNAALTPIDQVYYALRAITDPATGVENRDKIALAISFTNVAWKINLDQLASGTPVKPLTSTVYSRLTAPGTLKGYSDLYQNPYITYTTETGEQYFLWYEDSRSVREKVALAKLFGVRGISLWRLGLVPDYADAGLNYNVMDALK